MIPRGRESLGRAIFFLQPRMPCRHSWFAVITPSAGILGLGGIRSFPQIKLRVLRTTDQVANHLISAWRAFHGLDELLDRRAHVLAQLLRVERPSQHLALLGVGVIAHPLKMEVHQKWLATVVAQSLVRIFRDPLGIGIDLKPKNDPCGGVLLFDEIENLAHRLPIIGIAAIPECANRIGLARDLLREEFPHPSVPAKIHSQHDCFHSSLLEHGEIELVRRPIDRCPVATYHIRKYR